MESRLYFPSLRIWVPSTPCGSLTVVYKLQDVSTLYFQLGSNCLDTLIIDQLFDLLVFNWLQNWSTI